MSFIQIILFPISLIYSLVTAVRNMLYDFHILKSKSFNMPLISVGNLSYGGTGKTPMVEYLIKLLKDDMHIATLSRGYKRNTKGFVQANINSTAAEIGDEPRQFKSKFPEITVAVCEDRCEGVDQLLQSQNDLGCILLDDAFQHRSIKAGLNILLTDYNRLYTKDHVLPSGTLREWRASAKRADIIVVTKCPKLLSATGRKVITDNIAPHTNQHIFFSYIEYQPLKHLNGTAEMSNAKIDFLTLFSGIAAVEPLEEYLMGLTGSMDSIHFGDHHNYSDSDLIRIKESFNNFAAQNKIIVTTEKDVMRIETLWAKEALKELPIYYIPIMLDLFSDDKEKFNTLITAYVENARKN
jgi:tetraacyldisaccharide 4'-kinase